MSQGRTGLKFFALEYFSNCGLMGRWGSRDAYCSGSRVGYLLRIIGGPVGCDIRGVVSFGVFGRGCFEDCAARSEKWFCGHLLLKTVLTPLPTQKHRAGLCLSTETPTLKPFRCFYECGPPD